MILCVTSTLQPRDSRRARPSAAAAAPRAQRLLGPLIFAKMKVTFSSLPLQLSLLTSQNSGTKQQHKRHQREAACVVQTHFFFACWCRWFFFFMTDKRKQISHLPQSLKWFKRLSGTLMPQKKTQQLVQFLECCRCHIREYFSLRQKWCKEMQAESPIPKSHVGLCPRRSEEAGRTHHLGTSTQLQRGDSLDWCHGSGLVGTEVNGVQRVASGFGPPGATN